MVALPLVYETQTTNVLGNRVSAFMIVVMELMMRMKSVMMETLQTRMVALTPVRLRLATHVMTSLSQEQAFVNQYVETG